MNREAAVEKLKEDPIPPEVIDYAARCLAGDHHLDQGRGKLADRTGRTRQTVHRWIRGETKLSDLRANDVRPTLREIIEDS